ncbi:unnamed protein product [Rhizophagus irregularis]|nr:unnamed protein product [Rhizophagus irregularis]
MNLEPLTSLAVITDSASSNQAARYVKLKRLAPEWRDVFFGPCFAHQANLIVGEIFKESPNLINASEKAIQIITYLNRSVYFMARLRDEQKIKYNKYLALLLSCATRWNSHYHCYFSLIRTKAALKVLISKYAPEEFDQEDEAIYHSGKEDETRNNKTLPLDICKTIDNDIWWREIKQLEKLLYPFCGVLNKLQAENARLHDFKRLPTSLLGELQSYRKQDFPFNNMSLKQFRNGVLGFWNFTSAYAPDLSAFSTKIYAICINTASVERLFSSMGFFHTNKRNRLGSEKVLAMSQIKGEFQRQKRLENIMSANKKLKDTNIAIPVVQEQQDDDQFNVSNNDDDFLNQSSEDSEQDIESPREWRNLINEWIEMVEDEESEILNQEDEENDEIAPLIGRTMDLDEILQKKYPLISKRAKWKLDDIFDFEKIQPPTYLTLLHETE